MSIQTLNTHMLICRLCGLVCQITTYTSEESPASIGIRKDCDCGYSVVMDGVKVFERYPDQKGTVRVFSGGPAAVIDDCQSLLIIESGRISLVPGREAVHA